MSLDTLIQSILDHFNSHGGFDPTAITGIESLPSEALLASGIDINTLSEAELDTVLHTLSHDTVAFDSPSDSMLMDSMATMQTQPTD